MAHEHGTAAPTGTLSASGSDGAVNSPHASHEAGDINFSAVLGFGAGLVVSTAIIYGLIGLLFVYFASREAERTAPVYPLAAGQQQRLPPEPRLQTNPRQDLRDLRDREDRLLNNYGWVDKSAGVVRIPIHEAMKLTVQRGLPARPEAK